LTGCSLPLRDSVPYIPSVWYVHCARLPLASASADIVFCHQTFHHLVQQEFAFTEYHRVLKPGGILLFAEATDAYIWSATRQPASS
jgi:ubiquinone/menaquinone biosynthesis C-methylase UbiE